MVANDSVYGRESEAGSLADFIGGVERLEDPFLRGFIHATTRIGDSQLNVSALRQLGEARLINLQQEECV